MRRTSFSRFTSALILASLIAFPMAASADGPAFSSGAGVSEGAEEDAGGYLGSGHREGVIGSGTKSGLMGSGSKDGGLRPWIRQIRTLARLGLVSWAGL